MSEFDIEFIKVDPNFVQEGVDLLPDQFRTKENIKKFLEYLLQSEDDFQKLLIELAERHKVLDAEGIYLDNVGNKLGVVRTSTDDDEYRSDILATTIGVRKNVTRDNIVSLLTEIIANGDVKVYIYFPNIIRIYVYAPCAENIPSAEIIQSLFAIETNVSYVSTSYKPFGFSDNPDPSTVTGFRDVSVTDGTQGGLISNLIYQTEGNL